MNDTSNSNGSSNTTAVLLGFAVGAVVGAGVALLLAPESGRKTRERLTSTAQRVGKSAGETMDQARATMVEMGSDAKSAIKAGQEAFLKDLGTRESRSDRRMTHAGEAAAVVGSALRDGDEMSR